MQSAQLGSLLCYNIEYLDCRMMWHVYANTFLVGNTAHRDISHANYMFFPYNNNNILRYYFRFVVRSQITFYEAERNGFPILKENCIFHDLFIR